MRPVAIALAVITSLCVSVPVLAQSARAQGTVRDQTGRPLKGATVKAMNKDAIPPEIA
jgi:hypothetical protein